jgi:hypothetical protein
MGELDPRPREEGEDRYDYFGSLTLAEIRAHFGALNGQVEDVKRHYTGPLGQWRRQLQAEDMATLGEVVDDLLPMAHNRHVQDEVLDVDPDVPGGFESTMHQRITTLTADAYVFLARFPNSGGQVTYNAPPLD